MHKQRQTEPWKSVLHTAALLYFWTDFSLVQQESMLMHHLAAATKRRLN